MQPKILELSKEQLAVFSALDTLQNPTELAKKTGFPRTTIAYVLKGLIARGMAISHKRGKRLFYKKADTRKLLTLADEVRLLLDDSLMDVISLPSFDAIKVYTGVHAMIDLQTKLMQDAPRHTRVKVIQPNKSFLAMFDTASVEEIIGYNKAISESKIILDAVVEDNAYEVYQKYWEVDPEGFERLNPSYLNRTTDYVAVKHGSIAFSSELWIYMDSIVIIDWTKKNAILITNRETRGLLEALYDTLKLQGKKVSHTTQIEKLN